MDTLEIIFWVLLGLIFYSYLGYGLILFIMVKIKRGLKGRKTTSATNFEPPVTLFIAAYNEEDIIEEKVKNCLALDYPQWKLDILFVTDGSNDRTREILERHEGIRVSHDDQRGGKIGAINRGVGLVKSPFIVFCDANTMLNREAIREIVNCFADEKVGCVAGEKRIFNKAADSASGAGEGIYWRYESALKKWDAELYSAVGAAGELFAVRRELFEAVEKDTILDDFIISLRIALRGYKIDYQPKAFAIETASASIADEMKRKVRICAGGIQSIVRLLPLLNILKHGLLSFQYISHRVLRWTITPLALLAIIPINVALMQWYEGIYTYLLWGQMAFYLSAIIGWVLENRQIRIKMLFIPFYFFIMNLAVFMGFVRYLKGKQSVLWERARRAT
ncbi:MAG: glycosyltransferase family 2 protein [Bacteroidota bacterium]